MDFITKLPKSKDPTTKEEYDAILVIVDRLTKYSHIIAFKEKYTAEQLGHIVMDRLIRYHGIPKGITSDRDKLFTSNYWKTLIPLLGTKLRMSTAYHPETDGQTERTNQSLEQYLRHYINSAQNNWVSLHQTPKSIQCSMFHYWNQPTLVRLYRKPSTTKHRRKTNSRSKRYSENTWEPIENLTKRKWES